MNHFNPKIHHRRSIRLKEYDYSHEGYYFITICCHNNIHRFGKIENEIMLPNEYGMIAKKEWRKLPQRYPGIELGLFQIMPNHIHFILVLVGENEDDEEIQTTQNDDPVYTINNNKPGYKIKNDKPVGAGLAPA